MKTILNPLACAGALGVLVLGVGGIAGCSGGSSDVVAVLPLEDVSISTSGDYERYFDEGGERFHHLIDPATGRSPKGVRSVTVLAEDGLTSEALSKALFVLGTARGMALIDSFAGVDAIVVDAAGALHYSTGLVAPAAPARS